MNNNKKPHIMIVDDSAVTRRTLEKKLAQDYEIISAHNGQQALASITDTISCLIMDANMPGISGFETSKEIWKKYPSIPIIMHTAHTDDHTISEIVSYGFYEYIPKGTCDSELKLKIKHACDFYEQHLESQKYKQELEARTHELSKTLSDLHVAQAQVIHNERAAATIRLLSSLSHRLKNPVVAIIQYMPNMKKQVVEFITCFGRQIGSISLNKEELTSFLGVVRNVFDRSLVNKIQTTLEIIKKRKEFSDILQNLSVNIGKDNNNLDLVIRCYLDEDNITVLSELSDKQTFTQSMDLLAQVSKIGRLLKSSFECSEQISSVISTLLNINHHEKENLSDNISINEVVDNALDILSFRTENIDIIKDFGDVDKIRAYPIDLMYCFIYIIENAIDELKKEEKHGQIFIRTSQNEKTIRVEIEDNGQKEIPPEVQEKIFEMFFTTKGYTNGTGLGLHDARVVIEEKHKGDISVKSRPGCTQFFIHIPTTL